MFTRRYHAGCELTGVSGGLTPLGTVKPHCCQIEGLLQMLTLNYVAE